MLPRRQAHVNLRRIGGGVDQFRRRLAGDRPVQLVLHRGEELLRQRRVRAVIHRESVDVRDLLVKPPLAGPDFPDALQQFVEVILAEDLLARFNRSSSSTKPLMMNSRSVFVAQMRNCVAW